MAVLQKAVRPLKQRLFCVLPRVPSDSCDALEDRVDAHLALGKGIIKMLLVIAIPTLSRSLYMLSKNFCNMPARWIAS